MDYLTPILVGVLLAAFIIIPQEIKRHKEIERRYGKGETEGLASDYSSEIWDILMGVYTKLRQSKATVHRPWIRGCMEAIKAGRSCPPDVAIMALFKTGEDLAGTRWDTDKMADVFAKATEKLVAMI